MAPSFLSPPCSPLFSATRKKKEGGSSCGESGAQKPQDEPLRQRHGNQDIAHEIQVMNRTLLALMLAVCSVSSAQVQYPYNPDAEPDGLIGVGDILSVLAIFGQEYNLGTLQSDSSSAILYVGDMDFWDCKSSCTSLEGNWRVLDDYLVGTYRATLSELGQVWYCPPHLSQGNNESNSNPFLMDGSYPTYTSRSETKSCVCQTRTSPLVNEINPCAGLEDECGVCQGEGAIYECGCSDIPEGDCDCNGNQLDALGVCGGNCPLDNDGDGVCDPVCGNGIVEGDEMCDDGNDNPNDGCDGCQQVWTCGEAIDYWGEAHQTIEAPDGRCWFAENLRTSTYSDGSSINMGTVSNFPPLNQNNLGQFQDQICCLEPWGVDIQDIRISLSCEPYLPADPMYSYNFPAAVNSSGLCPSGWHVPSRDEYTSLFDAFESYPEAAVALSLNTTTLSSWFGTCSFMPIDGWNTSGWNNQKSVYPTATSCGSYGEYWTSTLFYDWPSSQYGHTVGIIPCNNPYVFAGNSTTWIGSFRPVRCIKDQ